MKHAYEEVKLALASEKHRYLSEETLQLCLEALRKHEEAKHNGYSNYPTWLIAAWIDNHEELYNQVIKLSDELHEAHEDRFNALGIIAQTIEAEFSTECIKYQMKCDGTVWSSMLNHVEKDLINYREVAETYI